MSAEVLERLHGPVGLSIDAKTPAEIAVSIIAQIVQVKNASTAATVATESSCVKA
jgi:xanthine dehydrogenase accessory factor